MGRIRISLRAAEIEVEGSDEFIARYQDHVDAMLDRLAAGDSAAGENDDNKPSGVGAPPADTFGEALLQLPKSATGVDQILLAGSYAAGADKTFSTKDANTLLIEQGIKLTNPSQSMTNNLTAKRVFKVGKNYRISKSGEEHLATLIAGQK